MLNESTTLEPPAPAVAEPKPSLQSEVDLIGAARAAREYQHKHHLNDTEMLKRFPGLGSTKTFTNIAKMKLDGLDVDRWLLEYRQVNALMDALDTAAVDPEDLIDELTPCVRLRCAVVDAMAERGNKRLVLLDGPSGAGKTQAKLALLARYGTKRVCLCEADESWKHSLGAVCRGVLRALDHPSAAHSIEERITTMLAALNKNRVCLVIDEAHHLGPRTLNLVKTIINQTKGEVVLLAIDVLFRRLQMVAYEEARQLTGNRLKERIHLERVNTADVKLLLQHKLTFADGVLDKIAPSLANTASQGGNLAFVSLVCQKTRKIAGTEPVTLDLITKAIAAAQKAIR